MSRFALVAMFVIAAAVAAAPTPKDAAQPDFFPLAKGTMWVYHMDHWAINSDLTITVTEVDKKGSKHLARLKYHLEFNDSESEEWVASDDNGLYCPGEKGNFEKPTVVLKYPLTKNATWDSTLHSALNFKLSKDNNLLNELSATVKDSEEIEVPAGKFQTTAIEFCTPVTPIAPSTVITAWYAPGVGVVKQADSFWTYELKRFVMGK